MKKKTKIITIVSSAVALVLAFVIVFVTVIIPLNKYNNGLELIENGKFDDAIVVFKELGDYKDSQTQIKEAKYQKAISLRKKNNFDGAIEIFGKLGKYKDSQTQITETHYLEAVHLREIKEFNKAIDFFKALGEYKDSKKQIKETKYQKAIYLKESKKFDDAIIVFESLKKYKDSPKKIKETYYEKAEVLIKKESYYDAYFTLLKIRDYKKAEKRLKDFKYVPTTLTTAEGDVYYLSYDSQGRLIKEYWSKWVSSEGGDGFTAFDKIEYVYDEKDRVINYIHTVAQGDPPSYYITYNDETHMAYARTHYANDRNYTIYLNDNYKPIKAIGDKQSGYDDYEYIYYSYDTSGKLISINYEYGTNYFYYDEYGHLIKTGDSDWINSYGNFKVLYFGK